MDENRISGTAENLGGKLEEGFGRATGDAKTRLQGQMRQAEGSIQDLYGQAVDSAEDAIDAVRSLRAVMHGFVTLEAAGGFGLPQSVDATYARLIDSLDTVLATWADR